MLGYQHGYHAGNFADVHKHSTLLILFKLLLNKPAPICVIDTHAGRGVYDLNGDEAKKTGEAARSILKLLSIKDMPASLSAYREKVKVFNTESTGVRYPGSPALAASVLRESDKLVLFELHPREAQALRDYFRHYKYKASIVIHDRDCYEGLSAIVPPEIKRGFVIIDPSYEVKSEYSRVIEMLKKAYSRWPTALYVLWYPILREAHHKRLIKALSDSGVRKVLHSYLEFPRWNKGMIGSGIIIINPPWQCEPLLQEAGYFLASSLLDRSGRYELN